MNYYIGIDLGTTNSAICSYDGQNVRVWKSPEQNDVTPSAIYIDKRGNRYYGQKAYTQAPYHPDDSATLFKRFMGTSTKLELKSADLALTPEQCSAEILQVLFGYLPEEIRRDPNTATVITVPAAFNQMKKDATLQAAQLAGLGKVALMQEPVAAVMSVMRASKQEGIFLIYDLGGGTFDVSIAENIGGKVNLLAHGGKEMCGGRDLDRMIFNQVIVPWLKEHFVLPDNFLGETRFKALCRLAQWSAERAKIELSSNENTVIALDESSARCMDEDGNEIYIDIPLSRANLANFITEIVDDTVLATRETLNKAGLSANDIEKIVFVGGPTCYKPLRDSVAFELSLPVNIDVNPMTAVAEGASIFAESIDWSSKQHNRKAANAEITTQLNLTFRYTARTPDTVARVGFILGDANNKLTAEIISADTGWTSGRIDLKNGSSFSLPLAKDGENYFKVVVYDSFGQAIPINENQICITRTMAVIGAIPASHAIGVEALDRLGGTAVLDFLVREGDSLPSKGHKVFKAGQTLKAGSTAALLFKLWEGTIQTPISDNRLIGCLKVTGSDFDNGIIPTGADIECDYTMSDSGAIALEVSIPCIGASFGSKNFYSRQEGQIDLEDTDRIADDGLQLLERIDMVAQKIDDDRLDRAREKARQAAYLNNETTDREAAQQATNDLLEAKKLLASARQEHIKEIRQMDLDSCVAFFNDVVRKYTKQTEADAFDNLAKTAQRSVDRNDPDFESHLNEMKGRNFGILWQQDWFVIDYFNRMIRNPYNYTDRARFEELKRIGESYLRKDQVKELRAVIMELSRIQIVDNMGENMFDEVNIIKG